jgi:tagatose 1,6-diphosphate aldolase
VSGALLSTQRARALDQLATPGGVIVGAAIDHRDSLQAALATRGIDLDPAGVTNLKLRVTAALAPSASMVLLDPEYAAAQAIAAGVLPGSTGLAVPLEGMGYGDVSSLSETVLMDDWSPAQARRLGAAGAKLLLPYRVDDPEQAARQDAVVRGALGGCRAAGLALIVEPIVYRRGSEERAGGDRFGELVIAGARRLAGLEPDILKLQYPGSADACRELDAACGRLIPWVLLGGGADAGTLRGQIEDACRAGASGFIVGRTLFEAALVADAGESERALRDRCVPLLDELRGLAERLATPWRDRVGAIPLPDHGWYR